MKAWRTTELRGGITADDLARHAGRSADAARSAARRHGIALAQKRRGYPEGTKRRALAMRANGTPYIDIARATGVSERTLKAWAYGATA